MARLLLDTAAAGVGFVDRELRYVRVNDALATMNGASAADHVGRSIHDVLPAASAGALDALLRRVIDTGEAVVDLPLEADVPERGRRHFVASYHPVRDAGGEVTGVAAFVAERTPAEAALRESLRESKARLRARDAQLRAVLHQLPVGVIIAEAPSGRLLHANAQAEAIWRHPAHLSSDVGDYRAYEGFHPESGRPYAPEEWPLARAVQRGETVRGELLDFRRGDGTMGAMRVSATPVRDGRGRVRRAVVVFEDITPQREAAAAEAAARSRSEQLYRLTAALSRPVTRTEVATLAIGQIVDALGAFAGGLLELSEDGREWVLLAHAGLDEETGRAPGRFPTDASPPVRALLETRAPLFFNSRAEWESRGFRPPNVFPPGASDASWAVLPLVAEDRMIGAITLSFPRPHWFDDEQRDLMMAFAYQAAQALGRARLYEAEREARAEAERERQRMALLAEVSQALAESVDVTATLQAVVHTVVPRLADYAALCLLEADGVARSVAAAHVDPGRQRALEGLMRDTPPRLGGASPASRALTSGATVHVSRVTSAERPMLTSSEAQARFNATLDPQSLLCVPLKTADAVVGVLGLALSEGERCYGAADVLAAEEIARRAALAIERSRLYSAERQARADAEAANRAKSQFLATMSHELRTPLNAIGGYAELMELGIRGPVTEQQREDLHRLQKSQKHLLGLINEVLNYARLETGAMRYEIADVAVAEVLAEAEGLVTPQARAKGLTLRAADCAPDIAVRADPEKLRQIVVNLLSNSVKFTDRGGAIGVGCASITADRVSLYVRDTGVGIPADKLEAIFEPFVQVRADLTRTAEGTGLGLAISRDLARGMSGDLTVESTLGAGSTFTVTLPRA